MQNNIKVKHDANLTIMTRVSYKTQNQIIKKFVQAIRQSINIK